MLFRQLINYFGQLFVFVGYYVAGAVGVEGYVDGVVNVGPVGVVVHFFGSEGYAGHECEGFGKVFELEAFLEGVIFFGPHG